jgi:hypothetical protein
VIVFIDNNKLIAISNKVTLTKHDKQPSKSLQRIRTIRQAIKEQIAKEKEQREYLKSITWVK